MSYMRNYGILKRSMNSIMFLHESMLKLRSLIVHVSPWISPMANVVCSHETALFSNDWFLLVLHLKKRLGEQQFISVGNTNDYSLIYKPLPDLPPANTCVIIDISKAMQRISLEEKFRLERRSNHYICKLSTSNRPHRSPLIKHFL